MFKPFITLYVSLYCYKAGGIYAHTSLLMTDYINNGCLENDNAISYAGSVISMDV